MKQGLATGAAVAAGAAVVALAVVGSEPVATPAAPGGSGAIRFLSSYDVFLPVLAMDHDLGVVVIPADPDVSELGVTAQVGGIGWDIAVNGDTAYVAAGAAVQVFDVSDPTQPRAIGQSAALPGLVMSVAVAGDWAYAAVSPGHGAGHLTGGVAVLSLRDPARPQLVRLLPLPDGAIHVLASGDTLFVLCANPFLSADRTHWPAVVRILDRAAPGAPVEIATIKPTWSGTWRLALDGDRLYTESAVYDVSDPRRPTEIGPVWGVYEPTTYTLAARGEWLAYTGGGWWFGQTTDRVSVVNVASPDPVEPRQATCHGYDATIAATWLLDRLLAVGEGGGCTVRVPEAGDLAATPFDLDGVGTALAVQGDSAFVTLNNLRLHDNVQPGLPLGGRVDLAALDVSDPDRPRQSGVTMGPPASAVGTATRGGWVFLQEFPESFTEDAVAQRPARLWVLDGSDPSSPVPVASVATPGMPAGFGLDERYGYVPTSEGLAVIDLDDPTQPRLVGVGGPSFAFTQGSSLRVIAHAGQVYVPNFGVVVIDVSEPTQPRQVPLSEPTWLSMSNDMALGRGNIAYVTGGATIAPVRLGPIEPMVTGDWLEMPGVYSLAWSKDYLYGLRNTWLPDDLTDLIVMDARVPTRLKTVTILAGLPSPGDRSLSEWPGRLTAAGDRLAVAGINGSVLTIDISRPDRPRLIGRRVLSPYEHATVPDDWGWIHDALDVTLWGDHVVRARWPGGLDIVRAAPDGP